MRQRTKLQLVNLAFVLLFNVGKPSLFFLVLSILFKQARFAIRNVSGIHNRPDFFFFYFLPSRCTSFKGTYNRFKSNLKEHFFILCNSFQVIFTLMKKAVMTYKVQNIDTKRILFSSGYFIANITLNA